MIGSPSNASINAIIHQPKPTTATTHILLVEDNPGDVRLTKEALRTSGRHTTLHVVTDGLAAMSFLRRIGANAHAPRPNLIILDLNLPRMSGRDVLLEVKSDANLSNIPIVVLTSSLSPDDVTQCYNLHANAYVTKPIGLDDFVAAVQSIDSFWTKLVRLPDHAA